jgi:hypothetical protein
VQARDWADKLVALAPADPQARQFAQRLHAQDAVARGAH